MSPRIWCVVIVIILNLCNTTFQKWSQGEIVEEQRLRNRSVDCFTYGIAEGVNTQCWPTELTSQYCFDHSTFLWISLVFAPFPVNCNQARIHIKHSKLSAKQLSSSQNGKKLWMLSFIAISIPLSQSWIYNFRFFSYPGLSSEAVLP